MAVAAVAGATAGVATAERSESPPPPPRKPLAAAMLGALTAPAPPGIVADVEVTNRLLPAAGPSSALAGKLHGTLRMTSSGRFALSLGSRAGRVRITGDRHRVTLYDERSHTEYRLPVDLDVGPGGRDGFQGMQRMMSALARSFDVAAPEPGHVGGRPAYTTRITPRDDGGLLGAAELSWDAERPVPLRLAVYAQGDTDPVLDVRLSRVSYERVAPADVRPGAHTGARRVGVAPASAGRPGPSSVASGLRAVRARAGFDVAAPATLAGLPRRAVRLVRTDEGSAVLTVYGSGIGTVLVTQSPAGRDPIARHAGDAALTRVNIDGATGVEFANPLATALHIRRGGISYAIAGLVPPIVVERAARELR
jgi:hypothetical protein